jgi:hypothetical protein
MNTNNNNSNLTVTCGEGADNIIIRLRKGREGDVIGRTEGGKIALFSCGAPRQSSGFMEVSVDDEKDKCIIVSPVRYQVLSDSNDTFREILAEGNAPVMASADEDMGAFKEALIAKAIAKIADRAAERAAREKADAEREAEILATFGPLSEVALNWAWRWHGQDWYADYSDDGSVWSRAELVKKDLREDLTWLALEDATALKSINWESLGRMERP